MTAQARPAVAVSHVGFRPDARKQTIVRIPSERSFDVIGTDYKRTFQLTRIDNDLEPVCLGDFSEITREGTYQIRAAGELSPPFVIARDAWSRHFQKIVSYHKAQRCGVAVPGVHPACHLDDSRRRDTGEHIDTTGGWHDAGDLRKWMDATMMNAFGMLALARNLGAGWSAAGLRPLEEELRWGNRYFLKMQDKDGAVFADVAGGVNGDNSDNHWTDNAIGTPDDRYLNPAKDGTVQGMFIALEAMYANHFRADTRYAAQCLAAAKRCWATNRHDQSTEDIAWWTLAAVELFRTTRDDAYANEARKMSADLAARQQPGGFWLMSKEWNEPYKNPVHSALPAFVLLEAARSIPGAENLHSNVRLHIESYVEPMLARSPYGIMPMGLFKGTPTEETYRRFNAEYNYRFFLPVTKESWWLGLNAHLGSHALLLATAARDLGEKRWRDLAYRQFEWIFGLNPFGISMASGIGARNPQPFSLFVGVIPGGIMNGICGNASDQPVMDLTAKPTWRTNEYWSPHVGYFEWAQSVLEAS